MFSKYCSNKYSAERCEIVYPDGSVKLYPELKYRKETVNRKKVNSYLGIRFERNYNINNKYV
jgi:phenylalanyl-tRNA synthetase beta chain